MNSSTPNTEPLIRVTNPAHLTEREFSAWTELLRRRCPLETPFLHPCYTQAVAEIRDDVEVAILGDVDSPVGFFPFQRDRRNVGEPIGTPLTDFQGVLCDSETRWDAAALVRNCRLKAWHFDHLVASQRQFASHQVVRADSPYMDLSQGWDAYYQERRAARSRELPSTMRKSRKLAREVGKLRFVFHSTDRGILETLLRWKAEHLKRIRTLEVLRYPWVTALLRRLHETDRPDFSGVLSALYAGESLVAAHFGMRTEKVMHMWFPAYNLAFEKYSPGLILLVHLAQHCEQLGIERIDLGKGQQRYKESFKSGAIPIAEGCVASQPLRRVLNAAWYRGRQWLRESRLRKPLQVPKRLLRQVYYWKNSL